MKSLQRGAIVWANLDPVQGHEQAGRRPVLLVSDTRFNERSGTAIAMPLTSKWQRAGMPFVYQLDGISSFVKISQVRVLSTSRLGEMLELRSSSEVDACLDALMQICGRPLSPRAENDR